MTYLGYPATTGLSAVDYRLTDTVADPIGETESYYCERLLRLPGCFLCYEPPQASPPCKTLPAASAGHVTFGSFNNACKINPGVISAWSRILRAVPESRLVLKARQFADHELRLSFHRQFALHGIPADRIDLHGWLESHATHLERYQEIDVGLDPFPYNGTTTTCESLWMGVPVVTLSGKVHAARVGTSILTAIGLAELIAHSVDDYVDRAVGLARDLTRLKALRRDLRSVLESSPLTDANQFTRNLEQAYRSAWREWCEASTAMRASKPDALPASGNDAVVNYGLSANAASDGAVRLHIGGEQPRPGWRIFNVVPGPDVDYVGNCTDLSQFGAGSVDQVYASHVLEHIGYQEELPAALGEIHRVLKPGGVFALSVPDLDILCRLFRDPRFPEESQFQLMRLMYGGQTNDYDFHKVGLTWTFICRYLGDAGFREIKRVEELGIFDDSSSDRVEGQPISLNVVAKKSRI
jgi:predicted SAM-dependent methyltransferase